MAVHKQIDVWMGGVMYQVAGTAQVVASRCMGLLCQCDLEVIE